MDDVLVIEAPHHMDNGVRHADIGEELVAQPLTPAGAFDKAGDVHEFDDGGGGLPGMIHLAEFVQPGVRHSHHAYVGVDGAEGVVGALRARVGDGVKECRFAYIWQADDA